VRILIQAAGAHSGTPFFEIAGEQWQRILAVDLKSQLLACQVFRRLDEAARPRPRNHRHPFRFFSLAAVEGVLLHRRRSEPDPDRPVSGSEVAQKRVRGNAVSPEFFPTGQNRKLLTQEQVAGIMRHAPMGRFGESRELPRGGAVPGLGQGVQLCHRHALTGGWRLLAIIAQKVGGTTQRKFCAWEKFRWPVRKIRVECLPRLSRVMSSATITGKQV
jgi:NAD(P)-dependent dehydrogenase (short-subunit alcohol dehydrogenase family)